MRKVAYFDFIGFGEKVKNFRKKAGFNLEEFSDEIEYNNKKKSKKPKRYHFNDLYYAPSGISVEYKKSSLSKIENGKLPPSTDFLFLFHELTRESLDSLVFGHTFPAIEKFIKIYNSLNSELQERLKNICIEKAKQLGADEDEDEDENEEIDDIHDFRYRLNEVKRYRKLTFNKICKTVGMSKNTVEKYHSKRSLSPEELGRMRNSALPYLIKFCESFKVSLDFLLTGSFWCDGFPTYLSELLGNLDYMKQLCVLLIWLIEAEKFLK